jgi:hypothetical protein
MYKALTCYILLTFVRHPVRYIDKFSQSLSTEYKQYEVDLQCQVLKFISVPPLSSCTWLGYWMRTSVKPFCAGHSLRASSTLAFLITHHFEFWYADTVVRRDQDVSSWQCLVVRAIAGRVCQSRRSLHRLWGKMCPPLAPLDPVFLRVSSTRFGT